MTTSSRTPRDGNVQVIRGGDSGEAAPWQPPEMGDGERPSPRQRKQPLTAERLDELQKQAWQEGYDAGQREGQDFGHREGVESKRREIDAKLAQLDRLMAALERPFQELDDSVEQEIITLVIAMVRQLVRREVKLDPGHIVGVVREALGILPVAARGIKLQLHPDDAALVHEVYTIAEREQQWEIVEDPVIQRGGCRIVTENSQIDATLESRLNALIAPLMAGERTADGDRVPPGDEGAAAAVDRLPETPAEPAPDTPEAAHSDARGSQDGDPGS